MIELSTGIVDPASAPPLAPIEQPIDVAHLARMTLGDSSLEREVLQLFDRQAEILFARIRQAVPSAAASHAHTLKGSSSSIGAWKVAHAAEVVELASRSNGAANIATAIAALEAAIVEARAVIAELLRAH
jgi:HPt (histidine-containing phosphotransfer) domain-containing protein